MANDYESKHRDELLTEICSYFLELITSNSSTKELSSDLMQNHKFVEVCQQLEDLREFSLSLKQGRLDYTSNSRGYFIDIFKALQSDLKHITWQMKNVATGDYGEKLHFLSEFSDSFNVMVTHVENTMEEIKILTEKYKELSMRDPLTGCHNRHALVRVSQSIILRAAKDKQNSTLLMLDLDFFKEVNDTYGHPTGDAVLCALVENIYACLRFEDVCCRYGGEEFLILLPGVPLEIGVHIAERIRKNIEEIPVMHCGGMINVTASIGATEMLCEDVSLNTNDALTKAIQDADKNLYVAKRNGRNQVYPSKSEVVKT